MGIEFVLCRRKDDHSITHEIARRSLRRWPDWEPVPTSKADESPAPSESPTEGAAESAPSGDEQPKPPANKPKTPRTSKNTEDNKA